MSTTDLPTAPSASRPQGARVALRRVASTLLAAGLSISVMAGSQLVSRPAAAAAGDGITAYVSAPFVQGPPSSVTNATTETFDSYATFPSGACNITGSPVGTVTGNCSISDGSDPSTPWGGATTTSDTPTVAGTPSKYPSGTSGMTVTFPAGKTYVGFWWSAGSSGDSVDIYDTSDNLLATFTTATLYTQLGSAVPCPGTYPGSATIASLDGTSLVRDYWWGRPSAYSTLTPTQIAYACDPNNNNYAHAFLNLYTSGATRIGKITLNALEFDNLTTSADTGLTPPGNVAFVQSVLGKSVTFLANNGTGSMPSQTSDTATNLTANTFTRAGFTFNGWNTAAGGTGTAYTDGQSYDFSADLTLYAQWIDNSSTTTSTSTSSTSSTSTTSTVPSSTTSTTASTTSTVPTSSTTSTTTTTAPGATTTTTTTATTSTSSTTTTSLVPSTVLVTPFTTSTSSSTTTSLPPTPATTTSVVAAPASAGGTPPTSVGPARSQVEGAGVTASPSFTGSNDLDLALLGLVLVGIAGVMLVAERATRSREV